MIFGSTFGKHVIPNALPNILLVKIYQTAIFGSVFVRNPLPNGIPIGKKLPIIQKIFGKFVPKIY